MQLVQQLLSNAVLKTPILLKWPAQMLPKKIEHHLLHQIMTPLLQQTIADGGLDFLAGKWLHLEVTDLNKQWYFTFDPVQARLVIAEPLGAADVCFSAPMHVLILLGAKKADPDTLFFNRQLLITGDTELGLEIKNLIDDLELKQLPKPFQYGLSRYAELIERSGVTGVAIRCK